MDSYVYCLYFSWILSYSSYTYKVNYSVALKLFEFVFILAISEFTFKQRSMEMNSKNFVICGYYAIVN